MLLMGKRCNTNLTLPSPKEMVIQGNCFIEIIRIDEVVLPSHPHSIGVAGYVVFAADVHVEIES